MITLPRGDRPRLPARVMRDRPSRPVFAGTGYRSRSGGACRGWWRAAVGGPDVPITRDGRARRGAATAIVLVVSDVLVKALGLWLPGYARRGYGEVLLAAALQGAIFAFVKAALDRGAAVATRKVTGFWPGEGGEPGKPGKGR
jgi:hypothetical protein